LKFWWQNHLKRGELLDQGKNGRTVLKLIIVIIIIGKTALFEPQPSLEDSVRLYLVFTSLDFVTVFLQSKSSA
jgi:hypothetical protein